MRSLTKASIGALSAIAMTLTGLAGVSSAYAAVTDPVNIVIENISAGDTFVAYRLLDLETQYDTSSGQDAYEYNLSTSANAAEYTAAMLAAGEYSPALTGSETDDQKLEAITEYITSRLEDNIELTSSTDTRLRTFGNNVYAQISTLTPDAADGTQGGNATDGYTYTFEDVTQGYWLIVQTNASGCSNSYVMIGTADEEGLTITKKTPAVRSWLKIKDANISTDDLSKGSSPANTTTGATLINNHDFNVVEKITENPVTCAVTITEKGTVGSDNYSAWQDSADYSYYNSVSVANDTNAFDATNRLIIPISLTTVVDSGYEDQTIQMHINVPVGLWTGNAGTIDKTALSLTVDGVPIDRDLYTIQQIGSYNTSAADGEVIAVADLSKIPEVSTGSTISFAYLMSTGFNSIVNNLGVTGYVEFVDNATGIIQESALDLVKVFQYSLVVKKTDEDGTPLRGAVFELQQFVAGVGTETWKDVTDGDWRYVINGQANNHEVKCVDSEGNATSTQDDIVECSTAFSNLGDGYYRLVETTAPDGYNTIEPQYFTITASHQTLSDDPQLTKLTATGETDAITGTTSTTKNFVLSDGDVDTGVLTTVIVNRMGSRLPSTGGMGTVIFYTIGGIAILIAAMGLAYSLRKREDA